MASTGGCCTNDIFGDIDDGSEGQLLYNGNFVVGLDRCRWIPEIFSFHRKTEENKN